MKIAICTPVHGDTRALFTLCLSRMLIRSARTRFLDEQRKPFDVQIEVFMRSSSILPLTRQGLVNAAAEWSADWILWLDSDQTFPTDTLLRLLGHKKHVVGCNYPGRMTGLPIAKYLAEGGIHSPVETTKEKAGQLEEVGTTGLGVCLVSMGAIRAAKGPLFAYEVNDDGTPKTGEDSWFFHRLREAGYPLFIDHSLSLEIGHISSQVLAFSEQANTET